MDITDKLNEYKKITDEWISISGRKDKIREGRYIAGNDIMQYSEKIDKTPLEFSAVDLYTLIHKEICVKTLSEYNSFKNGFSQLYEYCISRGYIQRNITHDALLSTEKAWESISGHTLFVTDDDIRKLFNSFKRNQAHNEALFLSLYENLGRNCREIARIKRSDFDYDNRTVRRIDGTVINISERLAKRLLSLDELDVYESKSGQQFKLARMYNSLFPRLSYRDGADYDEQTYNEKLAVNLNAEIRRIGADMGVELSAKGIYESGVLHNISTYMGGIDNMVDALTDNDKAKNKLLKEALAHYGYKMEIYSLKYLYKGIAAKLRSKTNK